MRARDRDEPGAPWGLASGVVAIGGSATPPPRTIAEAAAPLDKRSADRLHRFAEVPVGSFVWTRDPAGDYWLGRITGDWQFVPSPVGLPHARATTWLDRPASAGEVPEAVVATFARGGRNFQRTHDANAERQTAALWDLLHE